MIISNKTIELLTILICEKTQHRKGYELVQFFNCVGFNDTYGQGFPSRSFYTENKLREINGKPELDQCIKNLFAPVNFVGNYDYLSTLLHEFNDYLAFDGYIIEIKGREVIFKRAGEINIKLEPKIVEKSTTNEVEFLEKDFGIIDLTELGLENRIEGILCSRIIEIQKSIESDMPLSTIFLCGSVLEGLLFGISIHRIKDFNLAVSSPKDVNGKVKKFDNWTLNDYINVAAELELIKKDVKEFSSSMRDFRNYIHPYQQMVNNFDPDIHTAKVSWQVLKAAVHQLIQSK
jgi:hypothetical protein